MRSLILPQKCINFPKRFIKQREIRFSLQDSKRPKGLCLFDFFPKYNIFRGSKKNFLPYFKTRPDTRLPQSHTGGQGPYLRSVEHLGRSGIAKNPINAKKVKCDGPTDGRTDGRTDKAGWRVAKHATKNHEKSNMWPTDRQTDRPTKRGVESRARD